MMLKPESIYCVQTPIDMRYGVTWLTLFVQTHFNGDWQNGTAFIFTNRRSNVLKILQFDAYGVWVCQKWLHQGSFPKFNSGEKSISLTPNQFEWLCKGFDYYRVQGLDLSYYG